MFTTQAPVTFRAKVLYSAQLLHFTLVHGKYVCTPNTGTLLHFMVFGYLCLGQIIYQSMNQLEMLVSAPKIHEQHPVQAVTAFQPEMPNLTRNADL